MKNNIRKRIIIFTLLCALVLGGVLASYAFFIGASNNTKQEALTVNTGNIALSFNDGTSSFQGSLNFGGSATKSFTIENTGSLDATARMKWDNLTNTYLNGSLTYTLSYSGSENGTYTEIVSNKNVPRSTEATTKLLADNLIIPVGQKYFYKLTITLNYSDTVDQTADLDAILTTNFTLEDRTNIKTYTLMARSSEFYVKEFWSQAANIKTVIFETEMNPKENATYSYDVSEAKDESIMSYLVPNSEDNTKYDSYIQADGEITANTDCSYFFYNLTNLEAIEGIEYFNTSSVTNMYCMFWNCVSLARIDLHNFDTSNVTNMSGMFTSCGSLTSLDVSNFDTSSVTNMYGMFYNCFGLKILDVSNFDTRNVINMGSMFSGFSYYKMSLTEIIGINNFCTSGVTNMSEMFNACINLTSLDVSNFDTSSVTNMRSMFASCNSLISLDVSNFDTSKVTNMSYMFSGCSSLTSLDLSNFDTSNVTTMEYMFYECTSLKDLSLTNFDTSNVTDIRQIFYNCSNLTTAITIRGTKITNYYGMFQYAATTPDAQITVNYTADASSLVDEMIATKSANSNVVKGSLVTT